MKRTSTLRALVLGAALISAVDSLVARTIEGSLSAGDRTLQGGEWADDHTIEVRGGESIVIDLRSTEFDPYLLVLKPDGKFLENDDYLESSERSRIEIPNAEAGTYRVTVTSYEKGESGRYRLEVPDAPRSAAASGGHQRRSPGRAGPPRNRRRDAQQWRTARRVCLYRTRGRHRHD